MNLPHARVWVFPLKKTNAVEREFASDKKINRDAMNEKSNFFGLFRFSFLSFFFFFDELLER
jgi:hypothetical protein